MNKQVFAEAIEIFLWYCNRRASRPISRIIDLCIANEPGPVDGRPELREYFSYSRIIIQANINKNHFGENYND
jgi:hypothetical protein